ncbi:MAG TPA: hypothetical protein VFL59_09720 [Candidatus Nanopelagicales bacterium]|nr:hypothetical protein [Candidatus Nanopelagicales bacterium]
MAAPRRDDSLPRAPFDGHLDLDALDAGQDLADLDVIGQESPGLGETVAAWFARSGVTGFLARHRAAMVAAGVVVALVAVSGLVWWVRRPAPLGDPHVAARAAGDEPTAVLLTDPTTGDYSGLQQRLVVSSAEPDGIILRLLGIAGPGLVVDPRGPGVPFDAQSADDPVVVGSELACSTPEATTAALSSGATDYALLLRRASVDGESRDYRVPYAGSATLAALVHRACLQEAADRDLVVSRLTATPVPGAVALKLAVDLTNSSPRVWTGLHVAAAAQPVVTNDGPPVQLEPGTSGAMHALFWPEDCADPVGSLRAGIPVEADLGPTGLAPSQSPPTSSLLLRLDGAMVDDIARTAIALCGTTPPRGTVTWARLREGGGNGSGGVIDLGLTLTTPGAGIVEVDHLGDGGTTTGELFAYESPVHAVDGVASIKTQWRLPACPSIVKNGLPRMHVVLAGDVRRPYLVPLQGDPLRTVLFRLCGNEVADLVR